jgi:hypothetical protein
MAGEVESRPTRVTLQMSIRHYITLVEEANRHPLDWFGDEKNYNVKTERQWGSGIDYNPDDEEDEGPSSFPSGGHWFICTHWADYVRRAYGDRAKLYGFSCDDNPAQGLVGKFDGHDFAVVDDRYIVDGWLPNVEALHHRAVIDMQDPASKEIIAKFYGDPKLWKHNVKREKQVDGENRKQRALAMRGVGPFPKF